MHVETAEISPAAEAPRIARVVRAAVKPLRDLFQVHAGKMIFEIVPRTAWHKGAAVQWINGHLGGPERLSIYFGDDRTDEDAFRALPEGVTFKVGAAGETHAKYRVENTTDVPQFLQWLERQ
jgi:trehalose 6-phosphate phosphatase